jgi:hypothetical protein
MTPRSLSTASAEVAIGPASIGDLPLGVVSATQRGKRNGGSVAPHVAQRKPRAAFTQAIVVRRDLRLIVRQLLPYIAQAIIAPLTQRGPECEPVPREQAGQPWVEGDCQVCFFCVHSERALLEVFDSATQHRIAAHLIYKPPGLSADATRTAVCCAVGPAVTQQIVTVTRHLVTW